MAIAEHNTRVAVTMSKDEWKAFDAERHSLGYKNVAQYLLISAREKYRLDRGNKQQALAAPIA